MANQLTDSEAKQLTLVLRPIVNLLTELAEPCYGKKWIRETADSLELEYEKFRKMVHGDKKVRRKR